MLNCSRGKNERGRRLVLLGLAARPPKKPCMVLIAREAKGDVRQDPAAKGAISFHNAKPVAAPSGSRHDHLGNARSKSIGWETCQIRSDDAFALRNRWGRPISARSFSGSHAMQVVAAAENTFRPNDAFDGRVGITESGVGGPDSG